MEYSMIDWYDDYAWTTVVESSSEYPVEPVLFNRMPAELRAGVLSYLTWVEEMQVFYDYPILKHPFNELQALYPVKKQSWCMFNTSP